MSLPTNSRRSLHYITSHKRTRRLITTSSPFETTCLARRIVQIVASTVPYVAFIKCDDDEIGNPYYIGSRN